MIDLSKVRNYYVACDKCEKETGYAHIISTKTPPPLMKHSLASPSTVADVMTKKYVDGLPLARQEKIWKLPPLSRKEMKVLTKEEIQRFLIQAKEEGMYELFLLELTTGMRRGELLALQWNDIDFKTGKLRISRQVYPVGGELVISEPKTKAANRTVIIPPAIMDVLRSYKTEVFSEWLFPSRMKPEQPLDPTYVRKRLQMILERAGCKKVRFHDLRHTFATMSLEHGMDVKTLSTIIGHVSSSTTLDIYTHVTTDMQKSAARNIDQGIAKAPVQIKPEETHRTPAPPVDFKPYKSPIRRPGTGCISQINDHLWEGRYSPRWIDGKRRSKNVYAHTREECEEKLKKLILQMKAELAGLRASQRAVEQSDLAYHS